MASALLLGLLSPALAQSAGQEPSSAERFEFQGDLRYRLESVDRQYEPQRNRHRIRARAGVEGAVNDTVRAGFALATSEGNDPRSSNVTLGDANARKDVYIDLAYARWQALPSLALTAGKMKYPFTRASESALFDDDVNPEGLAISWKQGDFFASTFYNALTERASEGESALAGAQLGWKPALGAGRLTLAAAYFDFQGVRGRDPFHAGDANGNTTIGTGCRGGAAQCLVHDYDLIEGIVDYEIEVARRPLVLSADFITNEAARNGLDTAWSFGAAWGRAAEPRTWEIGYAYQRVEKDAVFAQFLDSDLGGGDTDHRGHVLRAAYAVATGWTVQLTYHRAQTDLDVPASVSGVGVVRKRDYERLHLDLNFRL